MWVIWGVLPVPVDKTNDFHIDRILLSPDGHWQAVQSEDLSGGPATGTSQEVYLVRQRPTSSLFFKDRVFSKECTRELQMQWVGARTLRLSYVVGDQTPTEGVVSREHLPLIHDKEDEWRFTDPVKVVEARRIVHGNLC